MFFNDFRRMHKHHNSASPPQSPITPSKPPTPPKPTLKTHHSCWPHRLASLYTRFTTLYFKVDPEIPPMLIMITSVLIGGIYIALRKAKDPQLDNWDEQRNVGTMENGNKVASKR